MDYKTYWVGERPGGALAITILDKESGLPADISEYSNVVLKMVDGRNREVDTGNATAMISSGVNGRVVFFWPTDVSMFERPGEYVFQLVLSGGEDGRVVPRRPLRTFSFAD